jgi:hypothetical protein
MEDEAVKVDVKSREMQLDEMADFHARLSRAESFDVALSRRVTALEEGGRGHHTDGIMESMGPLIWIMVLLTVAPLVIDLVQTWRSSQSSS